MLWSRNRMSISDSTRAGGSLERDIEQAITALKKGAHLLKYGRRGKPKFCPFRLANDESVLIWFSGKEEKHLKLSDVSKIISGQRTSIFQRYPRPEKEYQSFSLIYNDRSLDLICKDKEEAEVWFSGLKALILRSHRCNRRNESRSEGISSGANSPRAYTRCSSPLHSSSGNGEGLLKDSADVYSPYDSPPKNGLEKAFSDVLLYSGPPKGLFTKDSASGLASISSGGSDGLHGHMKGMGVDAFRVSLSSAVSSSSHGSGHDDGDALGDVYIWGEGTGDGIIGGGVHKVGTFSGPKMDSLLPRGLESAVLLDVHNIACGVRHATIVTKQGETFSWGEEFNGRLGHGVDSDVLQPKLIDTLSNCNIELVACGEYHSCAVSLTGDLYTWGHGHFGILGHGNEVSHWVPKRVEEPLSGIHISSVSCGPWHTAVVTSAGQLFTFGDGTFGVLGHGDRLSVLKPREVESLKGLCTLRVACGVWHTAAVVEVMVGSSNSSNCSSGKLFTWGDGDKYRLGHGDRESKLVPTCVAALVEPNFCQVACGDTLTIALTTSGQVYVMGSQVYGQLGNPQADGKLPCRVEGKLGKCLVEEIACGAYHVAVLTSRAEVYTWGKGANGRLGHGDVEGRNFPTLVESLKDKQVKRVVCGRSFTVAICLHKWVSCLDQSVCSGCHLQFNFKRKRHNCYNCGLVFCHSCSNKKSLKASMAPNPNKSYRVCESCFNKLKKAIEIDASCHSSVSRRGSLNAGKNDLVDKDGKMGTKSHSQLTRFSMLDSLKEMGPQFTRRNKKLDLNSSLVSPIRNGSSKQDPDNMSKSLNPMLGSSKKFFSASVPGSRIVSRATSPISRRVSPPRSTTPTPTLGGLIYPMLAVDNEKSTNDSLNQEVVNLRAQVDNLTRKAQHQELELDRTSKQLKEAIAIAGEETAKCKVAKEVIKSLTAQLKEMAEKLPVDSARIIKSSLLNSCEFSPNQIPAAVERVNGQLHVEDLEHYESRNLIPPNGSSTANTIALVQTRQGKLEAINNGNNKTKEGIDPRTEDEWVEHDEPGVYITLSSSPGGFKDLKRVRFSRKRFSEKQAEQWWAENRTRVFEQYNIRIPDKSSVGAGSEDMSH